MLDNENKKLEFDKTCKSWLWDDDGFSIFVFNTSTHRKIKVVGVSPSIGGTTFFKKH